MGRDGARIEGPWSVWGQPVHPPLPPWEGSDKFRVPFQARARWEESASRLSLTINTRQ